MQKVDHPMKKLILATAALALSGGAAIAEFSVSGQAKIGLNYSNAEAVDEDWNTTGEKVGLRSIAKFVISFSGSGTTDGGLSFGADSGLNVDGGVGVDNETEVWVSGDWGKLSMGSVDHAKAGGVADLGLGPVLFELAASTYRDAPAAAGFETSDSQDLFMDANIRYDGSFGPLGVAISGNLTGADADEGRDWGVMASYAMNAVSFSAGLDSLDTLSAGMGYSAGDISGNLSYQKQPQDAALAKSAAQPVSPARTAAQNQADAVLARGGTAMGADLTLAAGDMSVTVVYSKCSQDTAVQYEDDSDGVLQDLPNGSAGGCHADSEVGIGISLDLGGGAALKGGIGRLKNTESEKINFADIGIVLGF